MRVDIVIPAHNEERRIGRTLHAYRRQIRDPQARFLVALDGTSDATAQVVRDHARDDRRVGLLDLPKLGKGGAITEAFTRCDGDFIGFVDADRSTPPSEFLRLVDAAATADGAIASRRHPTSLVPARTSRLRRTTSTAFATLVRSLFRLPHRDTQCGAKVFRRHVLHRVMPHVSARGFLFDVDLLLVARRLGFRIVEVPTIWIDQDGSRLKPVGDGTRMAASALGLWIHHLIRDPRRTELHGNGSRERSDATT